MESLEIARLLREAFPQEVLDIREHRGQVALLLRHERILDVLAYAYAWKKGAFEWVK